MKTNPDGAGLDAGRLNRLAEHLTERYIQPQKVAGCQVAVMRHGELGYFESFGQRELETAQPVTEDTIWRIYSMTKPITGVALMTLYERGLFQLNDPVHRFLPEWKDLKVRSKAPDGTDRLVDPDRPMSVRDLLMHMSGLGISAMRQRADGTLADMVTRLAERPLRFSPGTRWLYTVSTDICGRLVEVMSGRRFDDYLQQEVFGPLGMVDTGFVVPDDKVGRLAANYRRTPQRRLELVESSADSVYRTERLFLSGGGGLVSTTADYLRFCRMLLNGGELDGVRILGRKTVELMTTNHLPDGGQLRDWAVPGAYGEVGFDGMGFGLTMAVGLGPAPTQVIGSAGEYMWGGAASTIFWVDPVEDLIVVFMTQLMPSGTYNFRGQLKALIYPAIVD
jgi:CubicO group peptidase (beta-lactamase class C family)